MSTLGQHLITASHETMEEMRVREWKCFARKSHKWRVRMYAYIQADGDGGGERHNPQDAKNHKFNVESPVSA